MNTATSDSGEQRRDPLTIAYLAMGAQNVLDHQGGIPDELSEQFGGEMGFISEIIGHAPMLDAKGFEAEDRLTQVFPYEVAQPFGERMAHALIDGEKIDPAALADSLINRACG